MTGKLLVRLWRETIQPYRGLLALAVLCMALAAGAQGFTAWVMQPVVDWVFTQKEAMLLFPVAALVLGAFFVKGVTIYLQAVLMSKVGLCIVSDLQNRLFRHVTSLDLGFFNFHNSGQISSRFMVDLNQIRQGISKGITGIGKDSLTVIALVGVMFYQDWFMAVLAFFVFPAAIYPIMRLGKRMRKVTANTQGLMGVFNSVLNQSFQGIRMVKSYGLESREQAIVADLTQDIYRLSLKAARIRSLSSPIMETLGGVAVTVIILYGGWQVIEGKTTTGAFFSFITALLMAYQPMKSLANLNASLQEALAGVQRLFLLLDTVSGIVEKPDARPLSVSGGEIVFDEVSFSYESGKETLNAVSLVAPAGKTIALVGPSGGGKSTIINLIPRFYDVGEGQVRIDGQDVRDVTIESLHRHIALVSQEIVLFDDTVRANIAFGRSDASDEEIEQAARMAAAHDFIVQLPQGYDTVIGQRGMKLSGGQRQRLSIARAMLKNAPLLLLDEATSALDSQSERQVQMALETLMIGRTTVVIAHRLSTVMGAEKIYVIDKGRVIESGSHDALLAAEGAYARLYALQFASEGGDTDTAVQDTQA